MILVGAKRVKRSWTSKKTGELIQSDEVELSLLSEIDVGRNGIVDGFGFDILQVYDKFYHNPRFEYDNMENVCGCKTMTQFEERFKDQQVSVFYDEWKSVQLLQLSGSGFDADGQ